MQNTWCRLCKQKAETVEHIISGCSKLTGTQYTEWHSNVASIVLRAICATYNLEHNYDWWVEPEKIARDDYAKIFGEFSIQTEKHLLHNRPDINADQLQGTDRPHNWYHSARRWEHPGQKVQKNWQILFIRNWAIRTVECKKIWWLQWFSVH